MIGLSFRKLWRLRAGRVAAFMALSLYSLGCQEAEALHVDVANEAARKEVQPEKTPQKKPGDTTPKDEAFAPMVKLQEEDYAQARSRFQTKLTRKGPSPQKSAPVKPLPGVTEVEYASGELRLKAWMNCPAEVKRKHSAVLFLHGGFGFDVDDWKISQPYRDAGYVVLTPLLRGENGQPGAYSFYYDEVNDVLAAAEYLSKLPYVNADRIYIAGPSAGGTLVLLSAMASKRFRAAASFSGITDQVLFCKHAKNAARDVPVDITDLRELQVRSPLAYATSFKCPARIYYGSQEPHLHAMSQRTATLAKGRGLNVEAIKIDGNHTTSVPPAIKQSIEFFQKN